MDRSACKLVQFSGTIIKRKRSAILTSHSNRNKLHVQSNENKLKQESIHAWITQPKTSLHAAQQVWVNTKQNRGEKLRKSMHIFGISGSLRYSNETKIWSIVLIILTSFQLSPHGYDMATTWTLYHTLLHRNNQGNILEINYSKIRSWNRLHITEKVNLQVSETKVIQQRQTEAGVMIKPTAYLQNYGTGARYTSCYLASSWPQYK